MHALIAPDGFGGTLSAKEAAQAIADGWLPIRPDDVLTTMPLSDGGEGLLEVVATGADRWLTSEVAGPQGHPLHAALLLRPDGTAIVEVARACGLHLLPEERRSPRLATTYGVGQLLSAAREAGASRILVGLGGTATVDGGTGALTALGFQLTIEEGSGLKVGSEDLHRVARASRGWSADWSGVEVVLLADVDVPLSEAAPVFGPQKGATPQEVRVLTEALHRWADVAERDLATRSWRDDAGTGAAGGLGFGLACALPHVRVEAGASAVAAAVGFYAALARADLVVTGEGRLDATSSSTKVVGHVARRARATGTPVVAVVGQHQAGGPELDDVEAAAPEGPGPDPAADVRAAASRLAARCTPQCT